LRSRPGAASPTSPPVAANSRFAFVGVLYVLAAITSWGIYFPFAKQVLLKITPVAFLVFRLGIGAAILLLLAVRLRKSFKIRRADVSVVLAAGFIGIVLHQFIQLAGLERTTATNTGWILTLIPPVTGILGWLVLREPVAPRQLTGLLVAITGLLLFVTNGRLTALSLGRHSGDLLALLSVGTWSTYTVLTKARLSAYDALPVSTMHMALGFVCFVLLGGSHIRQQAAVLGARDWATVIAIGIVPSGLAYYWWITGLKRLSVLNTSAFLFIEAVVATLTAHVVLGEVFSVRMVAFAAVIVAGVSVAQMRRT
jgi:drug/metabolite transporter (DMT)-like permease